MFKEIKYNEDFGGGAAVILSVVESSGRTKLVITAGESAIGMSLEDWDDLKKKTDKLIETAQGDGLIECGMELTTPYSLPAPCPECVDNVCGITQTSCEDGILPCRVFSENGNTLKTLSITPNRTST